MKNATERGAQRLTLDQLKAWEALGYGLQICFGMSTFEGKEISRGDKPSTRYAPDRLDVDQWIRVARDAGMKYAVLTTKHVSGHCLWPSKHTDYHVGTSGNRTDVVEAFVRACEKYGVMPGLYYCSWDNHHLFGSITRSLTQEAVLSGQAETAFTTREYQDFQTAQVEELLTQYGSIGEVVIDIPMVLPRDYRNKLYARIAELQPECVIMMNQGNGNGVFDKARFLWPTDLISMERSAPHSCGRFQPWTVIHGKRYYLGGEVIEPIGMEWFYVASDQPRGDAELLGMYLVTRSRGANLLLSVGPDKHGMIPLRYADALMRLKKNIDQSSR